MAFVRIAFKFIVLLLQADLSFQGVPPHIHCRVTLSRWNALGGSGSGCRSLPKIPSTSTLNLEHAQSQMPSHFSDLAC
ncbi:hypothetical protein QBC42DRAFT_268830 [Cladorrhinum samala]|uniref:Secreted protein n=1 Tax=Cladorrhinum samala TaxID=585594 RepID=A0AAV9HPP7_9PEZI|nr:hypothetical protein QBC42DRAFT_268830 [Cladorrhinum samala]